jgi:hypothetical protein
MKKNNIMGESSDRFIDFLLKQNDMLFNVLLKYYKFSQLNRIYQETTHITFQELVLVLELEKKRKRLEEMYNL